MTDLLNDEHEVDIQSDRDLESMDIKNEKEAEVDYGERLKVLTGKYMLAEIKAAFSAEGVESEKIPYLARMVDKEAIFDGNIVNEEALKEEVKEIKRLFACEGSCMTGGVGDSESEVWEFKFGLSDMDSESKGNIYAGLFGNK